jgi:hypothetical protein
MIRKDEKSHGVQYNRISSKGDTRSFAAAGTGPTIWFGGRSSSELGVGKEIVFTLLSLGASMHKRLTSLEGLTDCSVFISICAHRHQ